MDVFFKLIELIKFDPDNIGGGACAVLCGGSGAVGGAQRHDYEVKVKEEECRFFDIDSHPQIDLIDERKYPGYITFRFTSGKSDIQEVRKEISKRFSIRMHVSRKYYYNVELNNSEYKKLPFLCNGEFKFGRHTTSLKFFSENEVQEVKSDIKEKFAGVFQIEKIQYEDDEPLEPMDHKFSTSHDAETQSLGSIGGTPSDMIDPADTVPAQVSKSKS
eukprot:UN27474